MDNIANTPAFVAVAFPRADGGSVNDSVRMNAGIRVEQHYVLLSAGSGHTGKHLVHSTAIANFSGGSDPDNFGELQALAQRIAADWYAWRLASVEIRYESVVPWPADGMHDVEWIHGADINTAVHRSEWEPEFGQLKHAGSFGSCDEPPIVGTQAVKIVDGAPVNGKFDALLQVRSGGSETDDAPVWVIDWAEATELAADERYNGTWRGIEAGGPYLISIVDDNQGLGLDDTDAWLPIAGSLTPSAWAAGTFPAGTLKTHSSSTWVAKVETAGEPGVSADWREVELTDAGGYYAWKSYSAGDYVQELRALYAIRSAGKVGHSSIIRLTSAIPTSGYYPARLLSWDYGSMAYVDGPVIKARDAASYPFHDVTDLWFLASYEDTVDGVEIWSFDGYKGITEVTSDDGSILVSSPLFGVQNVSINLAGDDRISFLNAGGGNWAATIHLELDGKDFGPDVALANVTTGSGPLLSFASDTLTLAMPHADISVTGVVNNTEQWMGSGLKKFWGGIVSGGLDPSVYASTFQSLGLSGGHTTGIARLHLTNVPITGDAYGQAVLRTKIFTESIHTDFIVIPGVFTFQRRAGLDPGPYTYHPVDIQVSSSAGLHTGFSGTVAGINFVSGLNVGGSLSVPASAITGTMSLAAGGSGADLSSAGPGVVIMSASGTPMSVESSLPTSMGGLGIDASGAAAGDVATADGAGGFTMGGIDGGSF